MTYLEKYFAKINGKRDELIEAQIAKDNERIGCIQKEIELLIDLCFSDDNGNALYLF